MYSTSLLSPAILFPTNNPKPTTKTRPKHHQLRPRMSLNHQTPPPIVNPFNSVAKLLWGKSLPPQLLISTVRSTWSTAWHLMMSQLAPSDSSGSYTRPTSLFRANPNQFPGEKAPGPTALHLYVGLPCPWAHRTLIVRALKGLEDSIPVSIASPGIDGSWVFLDNNTTSGNKLIAGSDKANGCKALREVYKLRQVAIMSISVTV
ncbi:unnamed protein product [Ilex paraguariensis]|uniref:GST N-terminal domain-containing protein n=1 Tax=Ilex paraguariensis TaxID=185542 RepID=A0ABC8T275_9AQUA